MHLKKAKEQYLLHVLPTTDQEHMPIVPELCWQFPNNAEYCLPQWYRKTVEQIVMSLF